MNTAATSGQSTPSDDPGRVRPDRVFWTIQAMRAFRTAVSKQSLAAVETEMLSLCNRLLCAAFPNATVFVLDRLGGFDQSKRQHVLTVEVFQDLPAQDSSVEEDTPLLFEMADETHQAHVIKIGLQENLDYEIHGWKAICPHGLHHDSTLLPLFDLPAVVQDQDGAAWGAVMYANASRTIGDGTVSTIESATINACLHNLPKYQDIATCLRRVLTRMEEHVYRRSREVLPQSLSLDFLIGSWSTAPFNDPANKKSFPSLKMGQAFQLWQTESANLRVVRETSKCLHQLHSCDRRYGKSLPPRDAIDDLQELTRLAFAIGEGQFENSQTTTATGESQPGSSPMTLAKLAQWLPSVIRGCAHGDLHGRNILIGRYRDEADNPTVFDYELSRADLLVGWDFVKLECELKLRCLMQMYEKEDMQGLIDSVYSFERDLADKTEETARGSWHNLLSVPAESPRDRLMHLVLAIRREAAQSLDRDDRSGDWYQEYLLLLVIYGVSSVRYQHGPRMRSACYINACVAVARSRWPRSLSQWDAARYEGIENPSRSDDWQLPRPLIGWKPGSHLAKRWIGTDDPQRHADAERLLRELIAEFPHVEELWEQRAFALLQLGRVDDAKQCLSAALRQFEAHTEELLCRLGRIEKDEAHSHFAEGRWSEALSHFETSFGHYSEAESLEHGHYPAINKAATRLSVAACLGQLGQRVHAKRDFEIAQAIARDLIETFPNWRPVTDEDELWHLATVAEAHEIAGNADEAEQYYSAALRHELIQPYSRASISKQRQKNQDLIHTCLEGH